MRRRRVVVGLAGVMAVWGAVLLALAGGATAGGGPAAWPVRAAIPPRGPAGVRGLGDLYPGGPSIPVNSVSCASAGNCVAGGSFTNSFGGVQGFVASERNGVWGRAAGVPGLGALNVGGSAQVTSVSCPSPGNCTAGGFYMAIGAPFFDFEGFVVSERNGVWGQAIEVPGLGALNNGMDAQLTSVSCASAGNCAAGGTYSVLTDTDRAPLEFVVSERNGVWGQAIEVPGQGAPDSGVGGQAVSVSCGSAGNCAAGGYSAGLGGFVVSEQSGVWGQATLIAGLAALNGDGSATVVSVSCGSTGDCAAGGSYGDNSEHQQGLVVSERNGVWGQATGIPGLGALGGVGNAQVDSVSCGSAGNCAAGGFYPGRDGSSQGFVVSEQNGVWGQAIKVPGPGALNRDGGAAVVSVSCGSAGNCAAGGFYPGRSSNSQGFVVSERNGVWGQAALVPGLGALNAGRNAQVVSVSCGSAGNCAAGGSYTDRFGQGQGFVANERNGVWGRAIEVPGLGTLNAGAVAQVVSVSCASVGSCSAVGSYFGAFAASQRRGVWGRAVRLSVLGLGDQVVSVSCTSAGNCSAGGNYYLSYLPGHQQGFVVSERNGVWGRAIEVPGLGTLNADGDAQVVSVSCGSAGNCAAGGFYRNRSDFLRGFLVSERNGVWGRATGVPGLGALSTIGNAQVNSVSCGSAGNCAAAGSYPGRYSNQHGFVISERNGVWGRATGVPDPSSSHMGGTTQAVSVSCAPAGNCLGGGSYLNRSGSEQGFVISERNGVWGRVIEVPGLGALNAGGNAQVGSVSCASAGNCVAAGSYQLSHGQEEGFIASERNGVWRRPFEVPGLGALNKGGYAQVYLVSCASPGNCAVGGSYRDNARGGHGSHGFVVSERNGVWGQAIEMPGPGTFTEDGDGGGTSQVYSVSCGSPGNCVVGGTYLTHRELGFVAVERNGVWHHAIEILAPVS